MSRILYEISFLLEMDYDKDENSKFNSKFIIKSYSRAADVISNLTENIDEIYAKLGLDGLLNIPYIGKAIASKIEEFLTTGKTNYHEQLKCKYPVNVSEFYNLEGIGPKTLKILYNKLGVKSLEDLEQAAFNKKIRNISGFSERKEYLLLKRIQFAKDVKDRFTLGEIYPLVKQVENQLLAIKGVKNALAVGSFRRMKEIIGDIDFLVLSDTPEITIELFVNLPEVEDIKSRGPTKAFVKLRSGIDADLLVVPEESFGSALLYFTGSKEHGIALRKLAISKKLRLNEWGLFDANNIKLAGSKEEDVYNILGLNWIPPELRENKGEILVAKEKDIFNQLINYGDLKGDLQVHSNSTDGTMSIEDMAKYAKEQLGFEYISITDHTKSLKIARGLDEYQLLDQVNRIAEINDKIKSKSLFNYDDGNLHDFIILSSAEVNILKDGSLDISDNVLEKLDVVGAAIHSNFDLPEDVQTNRLIQAVRNPNVDILFHPTGRIINKREGMRVNINKLLDTAVDTKTILEIDAHYNRLDLKDDYIRLAVDNGIKLVIDSDAHHPLHFNFLQFGIAQARRGWAKKSDILNTLTIKELLSNLK